MWYLALETAARLAEWQEGAVQGTACHGETSGAGATACNAQNGAGYVFPRLNVRVQCLPQFCRGKHALGH